jgi:hypothetical protein
MDIEVIALSLLPCIVVGLLAYTLASHYFKNQEKVERLQLLQQSHDAQLPTRLGAYERLTLFLERIKPNSLLLRVNSSGLSKAQYENTLVASIDQEFEHNITQQIYVTEDCWNVTRAAKNTTIHKIRQIAMSEKSVTADDLREQIINEFMDKPVPSETALSFIRKEVSDLFQHKR